MDLDETADGLAAEVVAPPTYQQATEARVYEDVRLAGMSYTATGD